ncbi:MAG TPA: hypothetical protein VK167_11595 [Flavipsychrobacter sp.]|nr:hypothetical protein [Flavipsychrobacter sp.]
MFKERLELYKQLEAKRKSKILVYVTSDRKNLETQISSDILPFFTEHLDALGDQEKISLFLYTRGGQTMAAWSLVNLLRSFCKELEVIVPSHCHSSGTLICLGANTIVMTKQATLGPIDPSTNGLMNPQVQHNNQVLKIPVSVEFVNGYIEMAKNDLGITDQEALANIYLNLSEKIHPLALGEVYKTRSQIQMLARKLLTNQNIPVEKQEKIINFLCTESGSHDYTIYRKEAKDELGLNIETPDMDLYTIINSIYLDIEKELSLNTPFEPNILLATTNQHNYTFRRCLIESVGFGTHVFASEGTLLKQNINQQGQFPVGIPQTVIQDNRQSEGWKYEKTI